MPLWVRVRVRVGFLNLRTYRPLSCGKNKCKIKEKETTKERWDEGTVAEFHVSWNEKRKRRKKGERGRGEEGRRGGGEELETERNSRGKRKRFSLPALLHSSLHSSDGDVPPCLRALWDVIGWNHNRNSGDLVVPSVMFANYGWVWLLLSLLWNSCGAEDGSCRIAIHLAPIIAGYDNEDVIQAVVESSNDWIAARNKFRSSYLQSDESTACIRSQPAFFDAVNDGDLVLSVVLGDDYSDLQEGSNFPRDILTNIVPVMNNLLASSSGRSVSIFFLAPESGPIAGIVETLGNFLCDQVGTSCRSLHVTLGPLMAFTNMCISDVLVLVGHHDMSLYAAALCTNLMILTFPSTSYLQTVFPNVVQTSSQCSSFPCTTSEENENSQRSDSAVSTEGHGNDVSLGGNSEATQDFTIDRFKKIKIVTGENGIEMPTSIDLETCRGGQILEPTKDQSERGAEACQYLRTNVDYQSFSSDFDVIRKAADICEEEFSKGNQMASRLYKGYRSAQACVIFLTRRLLQHASHSLPPGVLKEIGILDTLDSSDKGHSWMTQIQDNLKQESSDRRCESNWMWDLGQYEFSYFSQGGQDGVLQRIFENIGLFLSILFPTHYTNLHKYEYKIDVAYAFV